MELVMGILKKLAGLFLTKKKIIAYVSAVIIAVAAMLLKMSPEEVKEAVVSGPTITLPQVQPALATPQQKK